MPDTLIKVDLTQSAYDNDMIHNRWHPDVPMVAWVNPGDDFIVETYDWTGGFIKNNDSADDVRDIDLSIVHFLSGPIGVKGAEPGYHPGSTETYTVFQGSLVMELLDRDDVHTINSGQFAVLVIPPGQCHRIRNEPEREAASLIVKTNPHHKPGVVRCNDCTYFRDPTDCSLHRSWVDEKGRLT